MYKYYVIYIIVLRLIKKNEINYILQNVIQKYSKNKHNCFIAYTFVSIYKFFILVCYYYFHYLSHLCLLD